MFMRVVSMRIQDINGEHLPSIIRVFVDSLPLLCSDLIDDEGYLRVYDMATSTQALSAMPHQFWSSNPYVSPYIVGAFGSLHTWMVFVGEMIARDGYPIRGLNRRRIALNVILNIWVIVRGVGDTGVRFIKDRCMWKDAISLWGRTQNGTLIEDNRLAAVFLEAHEVFHQDSVPGFAPTVLTTLREYGMDAEKIIGVAIARIHRALSEVARGDAETDVLIHQQLLVLRTLIDDVGFPRDQSPFHMAFVKHEGLRYVMESLTYCARTKLRWNAVDIYLSIIVGFLG